MRSRHQEIGLSFVLLVCFSWFVSSCALGKTMASGSLQVQSPGILTRRIDEVDGVNAGYGRFVGRKGSSGGVRVGGGGGSTGTPKNGGGRVPGGAAVIAGAGANKGHQNSHHNGGTRNCLGSPTFIFTLLASHVVHWYV